MLTKVDIGTNIEAKMLGWHQTQLRLRNKQEADLAFHPLELLSMCMEGYQRKISCGSVASGTDNEWDW